MTRVLVAVDGSDYSEKAFEYALSEAEELGYDITVLKVVPTYAPLEEIDEAVQEEVNRAEKFTKELKDRADEKGIDVDAKVITDYDDVATAIVKFADEGNYDMIVLGARGRTGLETITLGSVSESVVRRARCPVLIVR